MSSNILSSGFQTGPNDDVAVGDVYDKGKQSTINKENTSKAQKVFKDSIEKAKNDTGTVKEMLKDLKADSSGNISMDKDAVSKRVGDIMDGQRGLAMGMGDDFLTGVAKSLAKSDDKEGIQIKVGDTIRFIDEADYTSAKGITDIVKSITDNETVAKVLDVDTQMEFIGGIIDKAIEYDIPDVIDDLLQQIEDEKRRERLLIRKLGRAIRASNFSLINEILDLHGAQKCLAREPEAVKNLLRYYRFPRNRNRNNYDSYRNAIINTAARFNPTWDEYEREGETIPNLIPFVYASEDALTLFRASDEYRTVAMIAPTYRSRSILGMAESQYPYMVLPK